MSEPVEIPFGSTLYVRAVVNQGPNVQGFYILHALRDDGERDLFHGDPIGLPPDLLTVVRPSELGPCQFEGEIPHGSTVYVRIAAIEGLEFNGDRKLRVAEKDGRPTRARFSSGERCFVFVGKGNDHGDRAGKEKASDAGRGARVRRSEGSGRS